MTVQSPANANPLSSFMRQPKIYINLPSQGMYWPKGSLQVSETGEYPVYSMTAKDEMTLKIPDALISGQAVVDVIQHCMPNIKNAWEIPNIDLDVILIAIRIATYGEKMKVPVTTPSGEYDYEVDLRYIISQLMDQISWDPVVSISSDLTVYVKPINYKVMSNSALRTFETQRIIQVASDTTMSDEERAKVYSDAVEKLNNLSIGLVTNSITKIDSIDGATEDSRYIKEFIDNADKEIFDGIKKHIEFLREKNNVKPLVINPTEEMIEKGMNNEPLTIPLVFDPSTFFA